MSILPILAQTEEPVQTLAFVLGSIGVAGAILTAAHVFHRRSVVGPPRLDENEPPAALWFLLLLGIGVWILVPAMYEQAKMGSAQSASSKPTTQQLALDPREQVELTLTSGLFGLFMLVTGNLIVRNHGLRKMGLSRQALARSVVPIAISIAAVIPIMYLSQYFTQVLWDRIGMEHPEAHPLLEIFKEQGDARIRALVIASAVLLAPAFEEILFRGHMQTAIVYSLSPRGDSAVIRWIAILVTSLLFAAVHEQVWMMPPIFVLSICLGYVYERTGNLWVSIGIHSLFNIGNILLFIFSQVLH